MKTLKLKIKKHMLADDCEDIDLGMSEFVNENCFSQDPYSCNTAYDNYTIKVIITKTKKRRKKNE